MTIPALIFGFLLATLYGAIYHFWKGGQVGKLFLYLILSWGGFTAGHLLAGVLDWTFGSIGPLHAGMGTLVGVLALFLGDWLSQVEVNRN